MILCLILRISILVLYNPEASSAQGRIQNYKEGTAFKRDFSLKGYRVLGLSDLSKTPDVNPRQGMTIYTLLLCILGHPL